MEHSLLHGLQFCGLIFALGGVLFQLLVLGPALRGQPADARAVELRAITNRWIFRAALAATGGVFFDLFVQVAEINNKTIYGGMRIATVFRYLHATTIGNIAAIKLVLLLAATLLVRRANNLVLFVVLMAAAFVSTLISHSAALPQNRGMAIAAQFVHIAGAAFWLGMLAFVLLATVKLARGQRGDLDLLAAIVTRFSPYALASVILISISGVYSSFRFIASPRAIFVSAYGLTLLLKFVLLSVVAYAGFLNWRLIRPQLTQNNLENRSCLARRFLSLLEFELSAGILLMLVAGILGAISPPSQEGYAQLNSIQTEALLSPRLPAAKLVDPKRFVGAPARTDDDLRYAEFTHQWSGVFVLLIGLGWLAQSLSARRAGIAARVWPLLLLPFGAFISAIADPEVWILHSYSVRDMLSDPGILEHQTGALLVLVLAWFGLRDTKREPQMRPLGYLFPIVIIAGSLMLLGHAHSNLGVSEELSSLINMQHAIIGGFGLLAGVARWFQIRQLPGRNWFHVVWPALIVLIGIFMAFFYRELTPSATSTLLVAQ
jgi:putative copper resistance protein D